MFFHVFVVLLQYRHVGPMVVDMRHTVGLEDLAIVWSEQACMADLYRIGEIRRDFAKKRIKSRTKVLAG